MTKIEVLKGNSLEQKRKFSDKSAEVAGRRRAVGLRAPKFFRRLGEGCGFEGELSRSKPQPCGFAPERCRLKG
jgi:hypothetical protein